MVCLLAKYSPIALGDTVRNGQEEGDSNRSGSRVRRLKRSSAGEAAPTRPVPQRLRIPTHGCWPGAYPMAALEGLQTGFDTAALPAASAKRHEGKTLPYPGGPQLS